MRGRERGLARGVQFVRLYNQLDEHLCGMTGLNPNVPFMKVVKQSAEQDSAVKAHLAKIRAYAALRNAIVHDSESEEEIIADPRPEALTDLGS